MIQGRKRRLICVPHYNWLLIIINTFLSFLSSKTATTALIVTNKLHHNRDIISRHQQKKVSCFIRDDHEDDEMIDGGRRRLSCRPGSLLLATISDHDNTKTTTIPVVAEGKKKHAEKRHHNEKNDKEKRGKNNNNNNKQQQINKRTQLYWVFQSIDRYGQDPSDTAAPASPRVKELIKKLAETNSQKDVAYIGRMIESLNITQNESIPIQERVIKATALTGLNNIALQLLENMLHSNIVPSDIACDAVCISLRKSNRYNELRTLVYKINEIVHTTAQNEQQLSIVSFNTYLAALCDIVTNKRRQKYSQKRAQQQATTLSKKEALEIATEALLNRGSSTEVTSQQQQQILIVQPDEISYNTVLHAAASIGNLTLLDEIWESMISHNIKPDIVSYNARLNAIRTSSSSSKGGNNQETDESTLKEWDAIVNAPDLKPNKYTIDSTILTLVRAGRMDDIEHFLNDFISANNDNNHNGDDDDIPFVANAFSAFFDTLAKGGEIDAARAIFDVYIKPSLDTTIGTYSAIDNCNDNAQALFVRPAVRHFNVLLEGYRQIANSVTASTALVETQSILTTNICIPSNNNNGNENTATTTDTITPLSPQEVPSSSIKQTSKRRLISCFQKNETKIEKLQRLRNNGENLFKIMSNHNLAPDKYTITTMMGLLGSSSKISALLLHYVIKQPQDLIYEPAVVRATMTAYGRVGNPSSACWIFDKFGRRNCINTRSLNVLIGALAKGAAILDSEQRLDIPSCQASWILGGSESYAKEEEEVQKKQQQSENIDQRGDEKTQKKEPTKISFMDAIDGCTYSKAASLILDHMREENNNHDSSRRGMSNLMVPLPSPDSQTYCLVATAMRYDSAINATIANEFFGDAMNAGIPPDGRFINAIFLCYGDDLKAALKSWKNDVRPACMVMKKQQQQQESSSTNKRHRSSSSNTFRNTKYVMMQGYNGLLHVCGRALRPDVAVRIIYAMKKENIDPNEISLNCYQSGKRIRTNLKGEIGIIQRSLKLIDSYESILQVECTKYNVDDRRRFGEQRVKIIV